MPHRYKTVLLLGAPGTGKGTQGKILGHVPGFFHISVGDIFRTLDMTSEVGQQFIAYSSRGELVPDETTLQMWRQNLHAHTVLSLFKPKEDLLVLDGLPRSLAQAQALEEDVDVLSVIHLVCRDEEEMIRRMRRRALKENRIDDADEKVIRRRFEVYHRETQPVLDYYPKALITDVDALGSPASVLQHVLGCLVPVQNALFHSKI